MTQNWSRACRVVIALAALASLAPSQARACPKAPQYARVVGAGKGSPVVPIGAAVLIEYVCGGCTAPIEDAPEVEVSDETGTFIRGTASWLAAPDGWSPYAVWEPEEPLVEGNYALSWMTPPSDLNEPRPFIVMGDPSDVPQVEFEAMLDAAAIDVGDKYECLIGSCGRMVATQHRLVPHLTAQPLQEPSISDVAQFLFRVKAKGSEGGWHSFNGGSIDLSVRFDGAQDEYCLAVEAMRVSDAEIMQLGKTCADDTLGDLGTRPTPYDACAGEEDEPSFLAVREKYRKAWCSDNAAACTQHVDAYD